MSSVSRLHNASLLALPAAFLVGGLGALDPGVLGCAGTSRASSASSPEGGAPPPPPNDGAAAVVDAPSALSQDSSVPDDASAPSDASAPGDATVPRSIPTLVSSGEHCKLLSNTNTSDPTPNNVQLLSNVLGADLGIPVDNAGTLYFFFGDTIGFAGIWPAGQSHPDSVGYGLDTTGAITADPSLLCDRLRILSLAPSQSIGPTVDPQVQADFAGGAMAAPAGHSLSEYIHNPSGGGGTTFANLPGDFEVPSGGFAYAGDVYVFYTTVASPADVTMKASYLAKWSGPTTSGLPDYNVLYSVDERFDQGGLLHGNFVNVAAAPSPAADYVYMFGTGTYRASPVHLARKLLADLANAGGFEEYDAASGTWAAAGTLTAPAPVIATAGYGETSVRYFAPPIDRWMFLAEELLPSHNRIVARFADGPEGPWSDGVVVHDMADPAFHAQYCCVPDGSCQGVQFLDCDKTGFYGSYLLPAPQVAPDGSFTVAYTMSSFSPYNVALFHATFAAQ